MFINIRYNSGSVSLPVIVKYGARSFAFFFSKPCCVISPEREKGGERGGEGEGEGEREREGEHINFIPSVSCLKGTK